MLNETDEDFRQLTLDDYFDANPVPNLFAVSRIFAEARKQMTLSEYKAFTYALSNIRWKDECPDVLYMDKKEIAKILGFESDASDLSQHLRRALGDMPAHSLIQFADKDSGDWVNGCFIVSIGFFKNRLRLRMNQDYLPLFGKLEKNYITLWSGDIYKLTSERSVKFYELLRENSDTRKVEQIGMVGIKKMKELFEIPKDGAGSYVKTNGHFDRYNFEKRVIDPVCEDLTHTDMIHLAIQPDGKYYEKVKRGNRVIAYRFFWTLSSHPRVATAAEVKQLQDRVDKDPAILKVAKDLVDGKKRGGKSKSKPTSYEGERQYTDSDYDALADKMRMGKI